LHIAIRNKLANLKKPPKSGTATIEERLTYSLVKGIDGFINEDTKEACRMVTQFSFF